MIFGLDDNPVTTPETDRRRGRVTVAVVAVLVLLLGALVVGFIAWTAARLDQSETRVQGEQVLTAMAWPEEWQAGTPDFQVALPFVSDGKPRWDQQIATDAPDLASAEDIAAVTLTTAGWVKESECTAETFCRWTTDGYVLYATVQVPPTGGAPQLKLTLTPADPKRT